MPFISKTPKPPYYAVVFTSINADVDHAEHGEAYKRMLELAQGYAGFLGIEPARNPDGTGVAVVYWKDHESILAFARDPEHMIVKRKGREIWYSHYMIRICKVERDYGRPEECWDGAPDNACTGALRQHAACSQSFPPLLIPKRTLPTPSPDTLPARLR